MPTVFISYAREDSRAARELYSNLSSNGITCWLDLEDLLPGERWKPAIRKAIRNSRYFLALLSHNSVSKRGFVQAELNEALQVLKEIPESEIFIIPIRLDDCDVEQEALSDLNWVEMWRDYDQGLARLLRVIQLGQKSEMAQNLVVGGNVTVHKTWGRDDFVGTAWHQEVEDGNPSEIDVFLRPDGTFQNRESDSDYFEETFEESTWEVSSSTLTLHWNNDYNIDIFVLPLTPADVLYGTQSVGNKRITLSRVPT